MNLINIQKIHIVLRSTQTELFAGSLEPRWLENRLSFSIHSMKSHSAQKIMTRQSVTPRYESGLGIVYLCGQRTNGRVVIDDELLGKKIKGIYGAYSQFVALTDAWGLNWSQSERSAAVMLEQEAVTEALQDVKIQRIAFGRNHRIALSLDGQLYSWGARDSKLQHGELGQIRKCTSGGNSSKPSSTASLLATPKQIDGSEISGAAALCGLQRVHVSTELVFTKIACGSAHSAALTSTGDLYTWGRNFEGQLGQFSSTLPRDRDRLLNGICAWPKYVSVLLNKPVVVDVCCGQAFTIVLLQDGSIYRMGERFTGTTRHPEMQGICAKPQLLLARGNDGAGFVCIASGFSHALAVTSSGDLYSWGLNTYGQLGYGDRQIDSISIPTHAVESSGQWRSVFAGGNYSAALNMNGQLFTWGNNCDGQLGHERDLDTNQPSRCEFAPKPVAALEFALLTSVVCCQRNLFAFAPTNVSSLSPKCGELSGGYELRIRGSGFWSSEDLTVRFIPLTEGRLPRGSLGVYHEATHEIVCQVPKFALPGPFAVEVAMKGKHFTTNGHVFEAFARPHVTEISIHETRLDGGERAFLKIIGAVPCSCVQPLVRFVPDPSSIVQIQPIIMNGSFETLELSASDNAKLTDNACLLHFETPNFSFKTEIICCAIELSYNDGLHFHPVIVVSDDAAASSVMEALDSGPHVVQFHDARVLGCHPNSIHVPSLPQLIAVDVHHLLSNGIIQAVVLQVEKTDSNNSENRLVARASLLIQSINDNCIICVVPPLAEWEAIPLYHNTKPEVPDKRRKRSTLTTSVSVHPKDWWLQMPRSGFEVQLLVSMNSGKSYLPASSPHASKLYAVTFLGNILSAFPSTGVVSGGTQVSIAADFLNFETQDAVVGLEWQGKRTQVPAKCVRRVDTEKIGESDMDNELRVVFETPSLPFSNDLETITAVDEGLVLAAREEVDLFLALDGVHFASTSVKFTYCPDPALVELSPNEALPGTSMTLKGERLVATTTTCVKLIIQSTGIELVSVM